jgi:hypothetical protein
MSKTSLWIVVVVVAGWIGFMLGYSMSAHTGAKPAQSGTPAAAGGGYGGAKPAASGGYGGGNPATGAKPAAGGYGR